MVSDFGDDAAAVLRQRANEHSRAGEMEGAELWGLVADTIARASEYPPTLCSVLKSGTDEEKAIRYRYDAGELRALASLPGAEKIRESLIVVAEHYEIMAARLEGLTMPADSKPC
jgi:hypothetical protein